jgi:putative heme transporter
VVCCPARPQTRRMDAVLRRYETLGARIPKRPLQIVLVALVASLLVLAVFRSRSALPLLGRLRHPESSWLTIAVLAELGSLAAYALIVRELLRVGAVRARLSALVRATLGGIAMSASLPGGQVASAAYWYRQLREEGAGRSLTALAMAGSMVAGVVSLAALFVAGVVAAGGEGPLAAARTPIVEVAAGIAILAVLFRDRAWRLGRRLVPGLPAEYSPSRRSLAAIGVLAFANWLLDCVCLWAALTAMHANVPVRSVLLAYTLAQLVASIPLLPGGGGTVEASLILTFTAFHHASAAVVAGVLLFRLISCWGIVPIGWLGVALDRRSVLPQAQPATA